MFDATAEHNVQKLNELIRDIPVAMLTTVAPDGSLRSRPMITQEADFDGTLWFFTRDPSGKTDEVQREEQVNVSYADQDENRYVSVSGVARVVRDPEKARELWTGLYLAWFPKGLDDPELALLKVEPHTAEYWNPQSGMLVQLVGFVKAALTGQTFPPGEYRKVDLAGTSGGRGG